MPGVCPGGSGRWVPSRKGSGRISAVRAMSARSCSTCARTRKSGATWPAIRPPGDARADASRPGPSDRRAALAPTIRSFERPIAHSPDSVMNYRLLSIAERLARNRRRGSEANGYTARLRPFLRVGSQDVQLLEPIGRADVVHPLGDQRLHGPLGDRFAALVRQPRRLPGLHEQRLGRGGSRSFLPVPEPGERPAGEGGGAATARAGRPRSPGCRAGSPARRPPDPPARPSDPTITSGTPTTCRYKLQPWKNRQ